MQKEEFERKFRNSVVGVNEQAPLLNGAYTTAINFDNAATTPPFCSVMREINRYAPWYSSIHRGTGYKSLLSSDLYDEGRRHIKAFVGADAKEDCLIYTKSTTEAVNILADALYQSDPEAVVLSTQMEHLANDLPWRDRFRVDYARVDDAGILDIGDMERKLAKYQGKARLVAVTGASNVTGYVNPVHQIAEIAHRYGAEILVDGAQLVPHCAVDMKKHSSAEHLDYLVFSAHKMYAPFGVGVLIGPARPFRKGAPLLKGGGAVRLVGRDFVDWDDPPYKEEAGTPNVMGVAALLKSIRCLKRYDMGRIHAYEQGLINYIVKGIRNVPGIRLFGCAKDTREKVSIISFTLPDMHHRMIARILSYEYGIAVRSGLFCAHPYAQRLLGLTDEAVQYYRSRPEAPFPGLVRVSLGLYNQYEEADILIRGIHDIAENRASFIKKYQQIDHSPAYAKSPLLNPSQRQLP